MKIVLDTNVIVAAFASRGLSHLVLRRCLEKHEIILSPHILRELEAAFIRKLKMPPEKISLNLGFLEKVCHFGDYSDVDPSICRDQSDLHILGLALHSKANVIVSGDEDLLVIRSFQGIPIRSPREFWELERKKDPSLLGRMEPSTSKKVHDKNPRKLRLIRNKRVGTNKR
ncbi:MAG: putative toxin-antitoxin system toxin component, PIN family [Candidatus Aminicenantes bacterium]|nr:putative toxin-antitoxin system toxin component, PIN family [Candidatus Aminicenantes bacterium]